MNFYWKLQNVFLTKSIKKSLITHYLKNEVYLCVNYFVLSYEI